MVYFLIFVKNSREVFFLKHNDQFMTQFNMSFCETKLYEIRFEMNNLSDVLRREYSLYGLPPFENAPIEEFQDYLMDGIPNPRSNELKNDKRYIRYLECKKILSELS